MISFLVVICFYDISGCEKGETDHGVGMNEVAIWWEVSAGRKLTCREEMVSLLKTKFSRKSNSLYIFRIYIKLFFFLKKNRIPFMQDGTATSRQKVKRKRRQGRKTYKKAV